MFQDVRNDKRIAQREHKITAIPEKGVNYVRVLYATIGTNQLMTINNNARTEIQAPY